MRNAEPTSGHRSGQSLFISDDRRAYAQSLEGRDLSFDHEAGLLRIPDVELSHEELPR
jgi:hypothetical protein